MDWKEKTLFERIKERWDEKGSVYDRLNDARESICDFFRPDLGVDYDESHDMLMLGQDIYEGSGPWTARTAARAFQGNTVSKKDPWFKYGFTDERLVGIDELDQFNQNMRKHISNVYQRGNFYEIQPQFTLDGWTIGSPLMFIEEDPQTGFVMCIPVHWLTYRLFYDRFNQTEGVIIKDAEWTAKKCFDKFCPGRTIEQRLKKAESLFSTTVQNAISQGRMDERVTIWRAVFKATDPIWGNFEKPLGSKRWIDVYFEDTKDKERGDAPLMKGGYYSKPYVHWDQNKKVWETASRTAAFEAIYDNLSLQQVFKNYLESLQIKVRPSVAALQEMEGRLDLNPEGITLVNRNEWNYLPKPIEQVGDVRLEIEAIRLFKENLSRHFHLEVFQMFSNLAKETNQEFRVLQLAEMAGERISLLLPTIESHEGYLGQVDQRVRDIERQAGRGPFNRLELENVMDILEWALGPEAATAQITPEFIGTLRKTQQMQQALKPIQYGIGALRELGEAMGDPNFVRFMVKGYDVGDEALRAVNFPQKLVNELEDYLQLVEQNSQIQAQREKFAQVIEMMKASKGIQGPVAPDSIAGMLAGSAA
jgi:hypothetical protein